MIGLIRTIWEKWKTVAHAIGVFQSKIILTIFYFTFLAPLGIILHAKDGLKMKQKGSTWEEKLRQVETLEEMQSQA